MKIYGIIFDGGDGSASIQWFNEEDCNHVLSDDYAEFDNVQMNEGFPAAVLNLPDDVNLDDIGITLQGI